MERLFIGVYPNSEVIEKLKKVQDEISPLFSGRTVSPENMHVTLQFIGMVDEKEKNLVSDHVKKATDATNPFLLSYNSIEYYPDVNDPKILWVRVENKDKKLVELYEHLRQINNACLKERKDWAFIPHLTLARIKEIDKDVATGIIQKYKEVQFGTERIDEISLVKSTLSPQGTKYSILDTFKLENR